MKCRPAFTLFELILAIALSATLLALIGTAVNLYLLRMETSRTQVEEAQLARSILATIAADVRAATKYQTQDISSVERLASSMADFNVDDIDSAAAFSGGALGSSSGSGSGASGLAASASGQGQSSTGLSADGAQATTTLVPGLNGLVSELMIDVARLPRLDELFPAVPQQPMTATATTVAASAARPSDMKTVRYFLRQGSAIDPSDSAATGLAPAAQLGARGLVRQTIDRAVRQMAEQAGNSQLLESGQMLLAPEVTQIQFRYFDGTSAYDMWDMQEREAMPTAVEVRIWLLPQDFTEEQSTTFSLVPQARMYSQTIDLPLAEAAGTAASSNTTDDQSTDEESSEDETATGDISGSGEDSGSDFGVGASAS